MIITQDQGTQVGPSDSTSRGFPLIVRPSFQGETGADNRMPGILYEEASTSSFLDRW